MRILVLAGIFATMALAQGGMGGMGGGMGGGGMDEGMGGGGRGGGRNGNLSMPSLGPSHTNRLEMMSNILKLNKDQKKQVKAIMDDGQKEAAPLREELAKDRDRIAETVASGDQASIDQAVKAYAEAEGRMARLELEAFAKVYKVLDGDQKSKTPPIFQMMAGIFMNKSWSET